MSGILAATLIGVLAAPTYAISLSSGNGILTEGGSVTYTLSQTNVPSGVTLEWEVVTVWGTVNNSDLTAGSVTGSFTTNGSATQDFLTLIFERSFATAAEGTERFYIRLKRDGVTVATTPYDTYIVETASLESASGQILYDTPGTYTYISPSTRTHCLLAIGAGSGGAAGGDAPGGGGAGGLAWVNSLSLTGGVSYTVVVGAGGSGSYSESGVTPTAGGLGTHSYIVSTTQCRGVNGTAAPASNGTRGAGGSAAAAGGTARSIATGGQGGIGSTTDNETDTSRESGAGGGAAGYTSGGVGGSGGATAAITSSTAGTASSGCGGGGYSASNGAGAGGGGTGPWGRGANGAVGYNPYGAWDVVAGGGGGSGGGDGGWTYALFAGGGGNYGGGGGGCEQIYEWYGTTGSSYSGGGGNGCARILWGAGRAYPTTSVADV